MAGIGELDEFQLVRPLGRGGMGEVYLGHDTILDRAVAIKLIGSPTPDAASRERFLIEARAIARLAHPNVVTIFRVGTTADGRPFLVQELIRGRSLDQLERPVAWRRLCELAIGIARGLDAAHRRGILHRDIKPANVMVDEHGTARLLDFGLAKLIAVAAEPVRAPSQRDVADAAPTRDLPTAATVAEPRDRDASLGVAATRDERGAHETARADLAATRDAAETLDVVAARDTAPARPGTAAPPPSAHTRPGAVLGTPRYTAPELWRGERATVRSDLYALGVLLYELATGVPPYAETELAALERTMAAGGARPVAELAPELPTALAGVITRCLAVEPAARPGTAAELVHALESLLVDAPAVPDGNPYRGLRAFDAAHRGLFFGRGADIAILVDRLRTESLIVVAGDSGIGKSSVCRAGVVPAAIAGALADRRRWRAVTIVPGRRPWDALCDALALDATATDDGAALARALRPGADDGVLIMIDQLEELVTLADPAQAARVAELLAAIADGVPGVMAVLAVRGDFLTRVATLPALGAALTRGLHLLRVLTPADLREAIVGPARAHGVAFESDDLVDELIDAVAGDPGALPLLQFTLAELWQLRDTERAVISRRALAELGGVDGALARHADAVLLELGAPERLAARRLVLRLVTGEHTRAVRDAAELTGNDPIAAAALESLVRGRIVTARDTVDGVPSYELAHEALIRGWGTLRDWLDDAAGQHAARNRLSASAGEWQRLARRPDLLWSRRQLDEVDGLDALTPTERQFVAASATRLRRQRITRAAAIAAVPLIAIAIYVGVRIDAERQRAREVAVRVVAASVHHTNGRQLSAYAAEERARAYAKFDADAVEAAEAQWSEARALAGRADTAFRAAERELEGAFLVDAGTARGPMARVLWAHAELAEAGHASARVAELLDRMTTFDAALRRAWDAPAALVIEIDRPARITLHPRSEAAPALAGGFASAPAASAITATRLEATVRAGSYLVVVTMPDGFVVKHPVLLARGERWTERIAIPTSVVGDGALVYVPGGRFLYGSVRDDTFRRSFLETQPLREARNVPFWISRHEVTFASWIAYLRTLSPKERAQRLPHAEGNFQPMRLEDHGSAYAIATRPADHWHHAREGEPLVYPGRDRRGSVRWERAPVVGISDDDAAAYLAWLGRTGRVPGARFCTVREWEQAARGADGREYPHGDELGREDANFDLTYDRAGPGLDEVGSFPASDSPYGISDLAGNADEMTRGVEGTFWTKGGNFYWGTTNALATYNAIVGRVQGDGKIGLRVCADAEPAR